MYKLVSSDWDSEQLGMKCGLVYCDGPATADDLKEVIRRSRQEGYQFVTYKVDAGEKELVNAGLGLGGRLADTEITMSRAGKLIREGEKSPESGGVTAIRFEKYWDDALYRLAGTIRESRLFNDPGIPAEKAEGLWRNSIFNSCNGRASYSIIGFSDDKPAGLISVYEKNGVSDIFLIAVLSEYQSRGIGDAMMRCYLGKLSPEVLELTVDTQVTNLGAIRFYRRFGYELKRTKHILHFWFS